MFPCCQTFVLKNSENAVQENVVFKKIRKKLIITLKNSALQNVITDYAELNISSQLSSQGQIVAKN